jgi:hypothetical protein
MSENICWHNIGGGFRERTRNCRWSLNNANRVFYGRCRSGRRWFWVASFWAPKADDAHRLHGWEDTEHLAIEAAKLATVTLADGRNVCADFCAGSASRHLKEINKAKRRARPPSGRKHSQATEYLYGCVGERHAILKKTKRRIYFNKRGERIDDRGEPICEPFAFLDEGRTGFIDRQKFEAGNDNFWFASYEAYAARWRSHYRDVAKPNLSELKAKMAAAHPDRGGSSAAFIEARQAYVNARRMMR